MSIRATVSKMGIDYSRLYSDLAANMRPSQIRELLKYTARPEVISFAGGLPNPETFPLKEIREITCEVIEKWGAGALQYGTTEGLPQFREYLKEEYRKEGEFTDADELVLTNGSQQALDLFGKVLLNKGDTVLAEAPSYLGGINAFEVYGAKVVHVDMDDDGLKVDLFDKQIKKMAKAKRMPKFVYMIPTFQNPYGTCMPDKRRREFLDIIYQYPDLLVMEDDPYGKLRFEGEDQTSLKVLDKGERVLTLKTLSKILSPGMRMGIVCGPKELVQKMVICKQSADLCSPSITQYIAWQYMAKGHVPAQLAKIQTLYRRKRDLMVGALKAEMPDGVRWTNPKGGMFLWVTVDGINTTELFMEAIKKNVAFVVGTAFYGDGRGNDSMRLNFSYSKDQDIPEGIKRLADTIKEMRKAKK